jgi:hypothetical protein
MALTVPLSLVQFPGQFFDLQGNPLSGGFLTFYDAGTTTLSTIWADVNAAATLTNPVTLDSSGFAQVFLGPQLYDVKVSDSNSVELYTVSGVGNSGQIVFAALGTTMATGSQNVTSGYTVLSTDQLVTVASTGGANPCIINLPKASVRSDANGGNGLPVTIKNLGNIALHVTPNGADTIDAVSGAYTVAASTSPLYRTITLVSDGNSAWWILGGIGV